MASEPSTRFHKNIDDVKRCKDGSLVLACNALSGRLWEGSVRLYQRFEDIPSLDRCVASVATDATVADIVPLNPGRFLIGLDSGGLEMLQLTKEEPLLLDTVFYRCDHDGRITSLALAPDGRWLASSGSDHAIKLWEMASMQCTKTFVSAHQAAVWKVVFSADPNVFLSCSKDGKVCSWDMRLNRPATVVGLFPSGPTTLDWQPSTGSAFAVGLLTGEVAVRDLREPREDVLRLAAGGPSSRAVHRLLFCPDSPSLLAICADDCMVQIANVSRAENHIIYSSDTHTDLVRGLCWASERSDHVLLSSAWDGQVLQHFVDSPRPQHGDAPAMTGRSILPEAIM